MFMKKTNLIILEFLFLFNLCVVPVVLAQDSSGWLPQQSIPGYQYDSWPLKLIADRNRTVHAFSSQWLGSEEGGSVQRAIVYNRWTLDRGWTTPVDVLLSPQAEARLLDAFLDQSGMMHLLFFGGSETQANIYYSKVPALYADQAKVWSTPLMIADQALNPENGVIVGDDQGNMVILFSGIQSGNGLYTISSTDYGNSWSEPEPIYLTEDDQLWPYESKLYLNNTGDFYTVWTDYDVAGHGVSVHFMSSKIGQNEWSVPLNLAEGSGLGVAHPNIIEYDGKIIVTYYDSNQNAQWMIQSKDKGLSWSEPVRIAPTLIGRNGGVSMAIDSSNRLHMFFGERKPLNPDIHGMWHVIYENGQLSPVEAVVSGPLLVDRDGFDGFDPVAAQAVITNGNIVLVAWRTDPASRPNGIWYSTAKFNTPELPVEPMPEPTHVAQDYTPLSSEITSTTSTMGASIPEVVVANTREASTLAHQNNPGAIFFAALIPVVAILAIIVLVKLILR
jgi:hypothetical protein